MIADALSHTIQLIETIQEVESGKKDPLQQELSYLVSQMKIVRSQLQAAEKQISSV